ncbi:hypothetical protein [Shewanella sp.]|uniref:hypothetical protein n=1 Tax=Shewanella sp. TaxID=50422 RepID=UPI00356A3798
MTDISALTTNFATAIPSKGLSFASVPVSVNAVPGGILLNTATAAFTLSQSVSDEHLKALLQKQHIDESLPLKHLLKAPSSALLAATQFSASLLRLGQSASYPLPPALATLIPKSGSERQKLLAHAKSSQGYILGLVSVLKGKLVFASGLQIPTPSPIPKNNEFRARLKLSRGELQLVLDPIEEEIQLKLVRVNREQSSAFVETESEAEPKFHLTPQALLSTMEKKLLATALAQKAEESGKIVAGATDIRSTPTASPAGYVPKASLKQSDHSAAANRLFEAFEKSGAMPTEKAAIDGNNLSAMPDAAKKLVALLRPQAVASLMAPEAMRQAIDNVSDSALLVRTQSLTSLFQQQPLAVLFQLLLCGWSITQKRPLTPLLQHWSSLLLSHIGIATDELIKLSSRELLDEMVKLASSRAELNAKSNDDEGAFFTLPYLLGDKPHMLEAKLQRRKNERANTDGKPLWQLKLKFSLTDGELMVNATKTDTDLSLVFTSASAPLGKRISNYLPVLNDHLATLGFSVASLTCQQGVVPASLLEQEYPSFELRI